MPNAGCPTATGISSFTERLSYMGPVRVWRQSGTSKQQLKVRAGGGGGIALMHARNAATLSARVHLSVPNWQLPGQNAIPAYFISGGYTAQALEIPAPVQLTESASDASGMRHYSLSTLHGLEFVNPTEPYYWDYRKTPNVSWRFIPERGTPKRIGSECDDKIECTYKPGGPGSMEVTTYVEGQQVIVRSSGVAVVPPSMTLNCNVTVTRGERLDCSVASDGPELTDIQWTFTDTAGHVVPGPAGGLAWGGRMVISGRMRVSAKLDGQEVGADTAILVEPRTWPKMSLVPFDGGHGDLSYTPTEIKQLAQTLGPVPGTPVDTFTIPDGPNEGWSYIASPITSARVEVNINDGFKPGTPLYQMQRSGVVPGVDEAYCSKGQFTNGVQNAARRHEGLTSGVTMSHVEVMRRWFLAEEPEKAMEAVIAHKSHLQDTTTFKNYAEIRFGEHVTEPALNDPDQRHATDDPPGIVPFPSVPCRPRLYPAAPTDTP
jgi:hypothetical protein